MFFIFIFIFVVIVVIVVIVVVVVVSFISNLFLNRRNTFCWCIGGNLGSLLCYHAAQGYIGWSFHEGVGLKNKVGGNLCSEYKDTI